MTFTSWEEIELFIEETKHLNNKEAGEKINKSKSYVNKLRKFYHANEEEKKNLAAKTSLYKTFYNLYLQYKENKEETKKFNYNNNKFIKFSPVSNDCLIKPTNWIIFKKTENNKEDNPNVEQIKEMLLKEIIEIKFKNNYFKTLLENCMHDNYLCSRDLNACINERERLKAEVTLLKRTLKKLQISFLILTIGFISATLLILYTKEII